MSDRRVFHTVFRRVFGAGILAVSAVFAIASFASAATVNVSMGMNVFSPRNITIQQGDTVLWTNTDSIVHTVTSDTGLFNSGNLGPGATFSRTFTTAGVYPYYCIYHGAAGGFGMAGVVTVLATSTPTPPPAGCIFLTQNLYFGSTDFYTNGDVSKLQQFLAERGYFLFTPSGYFGSQTYQALVHFQTAAGISYSEYGYVGPLTRLRIQEMTCGVTPPPPPPPVPPSVTGIDGPVSLMTNQSGTWTVRVSTAGQTGNLSYSVVWGDEGYYGSSYYSQQSLSQQSATFTHQYTRAGMYHPTFTVRNSAGQQSSTSITVIVTEPPQQTYPCTSYYYGCYPYYYNYGTYNYSSSYYPWYLYWRYPSYTYSYWYPSYWW